MYGEDVGDGADDGEVAALPGEDDEQNAGQVDAVEFLRLSEGLRQAFDDLTAAKMSTADAARWQRRLLAITNVAKRDLPGALEQLERFRSAWEARRR